MEIKSEKGINSEKKLEKLRKKAKTLRARIASEEAKLKRQAKKDETRLKILVGAYFLNKYEKRDALAELFREMDGFLTRDNDRKLAGLPPLKN